MEGAANVVDGDLFKLTVDNFSYWKPMMKDHLYCKDMHEPISCKDKPEAVAMIRKDIDRSLFKHVSTYTNAYELWSKLESMIQKKTSRNKASLVRRLVKLDYRDEHNMIKHLNSFKGLVNQSTKTNMKIHDELQTLLLLSSLLESWDTLVVTLSNSVPDGKVSMDTVSNSLLNEESRRKEQKMLWRDVEEVKHMGRMDLVEEEKTDSEVTLNLAREGHERSECRSLKRDQKAGNVHEDLVDPRKNGHKPTTAIAADDDVLLIGEDNYLNRGERREHSQGLGALILVQELEKR
ncbi:hypothetical protein Lal_00031336 [Lupinus albus]|nr:hypothetical protein Lal_00031336 [Lupinus albus]